jgi:RimJ/RimL family protein N-acetyltransferase
MSGSVRLRAVESEDLEIFFAQQSEPEACRLAAFPARGRDAFMAHSAKVRADPTAVLKTIVYEGQVAGNVGTFLRADKREVCYWLGREYWGKGIATAALAELLRVFLERPLYARVAKRNPASLRVVQKCGFKIVSEETYVDHGEEIAEFLVDLQGD